MKRSRRDVSTTTIELSFPIVIDGTEVRALQMRRSKVKDQVLAAKMGGSEEEKEIRLFANLCEIAPDNVEELDMKDYQKIQETYKGFFDKA